MIGASFRAKYGLDRSDTQDMEPGQVTQQATRRLGNATSRLQHRPYGDHYRQLAI